MNLNNEKDLTGKVLSFGALATLLIVTPWATLDPINVPKFALLVLVGFVSLALIIRNYRYILKEGSTALLLSAGLFIAALLSAFIASDLPKWTQVFGVNGRNTGLFTYVSLVFVMIASALMTKKGFEKRLVWSLLLGGLISGLYGAIQTLGLDPAGWVNPYSPVIGFLGNPDFQSSFIGMTAVAALAILIGPKSSLKVRSLGIFYVGISLVVISRSDAQQGFLVFLAGSVIVIGISLFQSKNKKLIFPYAIISIVGFVVVTLGALNKGPLASILHKESVIYRGDYWRAGLKMTLDHPFFGVGLDGYGDWYRRSRTLEATLRRGPDVTSNAAHNVLLDMSSNGGFPLLFAYLALFTLVLVAAIKVIRKSNQFDPYFTAMVATWVAYNAQSIISLNQIGLAIWGWVLGGAIVGYSRYGQEPADPQSLKRGRQVSASAIAASKISPSAVMAVAIGILIGLLAGLQPFLASAKYRQGLETGDPTTFVKVAYTWPLETFRMGQVAATLRDNKLDAQALQVATDATIHFPDTYDVWKIYSTIPGLTPNQLSEALKQMKRLDPLNPDLK
jgi:O-antigen ligase